MSTPEFADWKAWQRHWRSTILDSGSHGFEWNFAQYVLMQVRGLNPNEVTPQRPFTANDGRTLHIDFAIERRDLKIAIEVEGWDKTGSGQGKTKQEHDAFTRRIQSLSADGWVTLTVSNAQFMADKPFYQNQIRQLLLEAEQQPRPPAQTAVDSVPSEPSPSVATPVEHVVPLAEAQRDAPAKSGLGLLAVGLCVLAAVVAVALVWQRGSSENGTEVVAVDDVSSTLPSVPPTSASPDPSVPATTTLQSSDLVNPGNTKNCSSFGERTDPDAWLNAQEWHDLYFEDFGDVAKLGQDGDGVVCRSLLPDCEAFESREQAQRLYDRYADVFGDVASLDGDGDGRVCESLGS